MARLDPTGVSRILSYIKNWVTTALGGKANSSHSHTKSQITDFPSIPTVNNATLTIQKNGTTVQTFTANQSTNATANITVPTKTSDLTNDSGFITSDNTKIPLAGSNAISGSLIPATTNAYDLGGSSYQWNNAYIKSLTISDGINNKNEQQFIFNKEYSDATDDWLGIHTYLDKNHTRLGFHAIGDFSGNRGFRWFVRGQSTNSVETDIFGFGRKWNETSYMYINATLETDLIPADNNSKSLGTSTNKWRDVNTILLNGKTPAYNDDVIPRSGGEVMTGRSLGRVDNTGNLNICGGTIWSDGGFVALRGKNTDLPNQAGTAVIGAANSNTDFRSMTLKPDGTWTWDGTACQITSDQRLKQQISNIDDKLLDAWEDVSLVQYKYNDAVGRKGDNARLHTGYVVQQIDEACKSHNLDISAYGLYCHEEYLERTEEVEVKQDDGSVIKETKVLEPAKEHYSLRYTEALIVECAFLRREVKRLSERLEKLEK